MENTETRLQKLARFIVNIQKDYRAYYGMSIADIAHPRHRYLNPDVVEVAYKLTSPLRNKGISLDIISFNQIYRVLHFLDSTDLIKVVSGEKSEYEQEFKRLLVEYLSVPYYDMNFFIEKLKKHILRCMNEDTDKKILEYFNSKGMGFRVVDKDDVFFKVLKQGQYSNHPLRKQLESLTAENNELGIEIPVMASEVSETEVSGSVLRVYTVDKEPRVDINPIDGSTLTSLVLNRTVETCEYYILYPIFSKKKDKVDECDDHEVINNITGLLGFRMVINATYEKKLSELRNTNGVHYPLYNVINPKGNVLIDKIPVPTDPFIVKPPVVPLENIKEVKTKIATYEVKQTLELPVLLPLDVNLKGLNTKETKMKVATFELNDTFKILKYLEANDTEKKHPVSKRIQDMSDEYPRPIPVIRNLISKDDIGDILVITNNEPEGYVSDIICRDNTYWVTVSAYPGTKLEEMVEKYQKGEKVPFKFHPNYIADDDVPDIIDGESAGIIRSLHCFDYREVTPAKVLKFKK